MDTCVRNLNFVHNMASLNTMDGRTEMNDKGRFRTGHQVEAFEDEVICPKPRRMGLYCCAPELIKPLYHLQRSSRMLECDAGYEILEIFLNKGAGVDGEPSSFGCSPPPYCSPPNRASNPIVHDVQFCNQQVVSPIIFSSADTKTISGSSFSSASSSPPVRIEGFDCSMREKTRCEIRCDVRAYA